MRLMHNGAADSLGLPLPVRPPRDTPANGEREPTAFAALPITPHWNAFKGNR